MSKYFFAALGLVVGVSAFGRIPKTAVIVGEVGTISEKQVQLKTESGKIWVPKASVKKDELRMGNKLKVRVKLADLVAAN